MVNIWPVPASGARFERYGLCQPPGRAMLPADPTGPPDCRRRCASKRAPGAPAAGASRAARFTSELRSTRRPRPRPAEPLPGNTESVAAVMPDPPPRARRSAVGASARPQAATPWAMETAHRQSLLTIATAGGGRAVGTTAQTAIYGGWKQQRGRRVGGRDFGQKGRARRRHQSIKTARAFIGPEAPATERRRTPACRRRGPQENGSRVGAAAARSPCCQRRSVVESAAQRHSWWPCRSGGRTRRWCPVATDPVWIPDTVRPSLDS